MSDGPEDSPPCGHHRVRRAGKALVTAVALLVFLATAAGWTTTQWLDGQLREVLALDPHSVAITNAEAQRGDENVLLVGSDSRMGAEEENHVGDTAAVGGARSDTVMVAHLPADRSRVVIVSFPRDLQIKRPRCDVWDPVSGSYTGRTDPGANVAKLNTAYQVGGPLCVTKVVQYLSGLAVTRFVGIDFHGFKSMVDAVGGVRICVER
ncbi:MAG: LCP family protein, partial [Pseudonocardiaceae bacterium]